MVTFSRRLRLVPVVIAVLGAACDGDIPVGEGESSSSGEVASASESTGAPSGSSSESSTTDDPTGGSSSDDGGVCTPIENEALSSEPMVVRVVNNAAAPVILGKPTNAVCPPEHYQVEEIGGTTQSTMFQCDDTCDVPEAAPGPCDAVCEASLLVLVGPGASFDLEPWSRRMWEALPTPEGCTDAEDNICFHGLAFEGDDAPEVRLSLFGELTTPEMYACAGGEDACVLEGTETFGRPLPAIASIDFQPAVAQIDVVITD